MSSSACGVELWCHWMC